MTGKAADKPQGKRVKLHAQKRKTKRRLRLHVSQPGVIEIADGTYKGHPADLIDAPEGTKIERPKESDHAAKMRG